MTCECGKGGGELRESREQLTAVSEARGEWAYREGLPVAMPFHCPVAEEVDCGLGRCLACEISGQGRMRTSITEAGRRLEQGSAAMPWKMSHSLISSC